MHLSFFLKRFVYNSISPTWISFIIKVIFDFKFKSWSKCGDITFFKAIFRNNDSTIDILFKLISSDQLFKVSFFYIFNDILSHCKLAPLSLIGLLCSFSSRIEITNPDYSIPFQLWLFNKAFIQNVPLFISSSSVFLMCFRMTIYEKHSFPLNFETYAYSSFIG